MTDSEIQRYQFCMALVCDFEMIEHFGGPTGGVDEVDEVEYQRHLLCFQAKLHAQEQIAARNAPSPS